MSEVFVPKEVVDEVSEMLESIFGALPVHAHDVAENLCNLIAEKSNIFKKESQAGS